MKSLSLSLLHLERARWMYIASRYGHFTLAFLAAANGFFLNKLFSKIFAALFACFLSYCSKIALSFVLSNLSLFFHYCLVLFFKLQYVILFFAWNTFSLLFSSKELSYTHQLANLLPWESERLSNFSFIIVSGRMIRLS